MSELKLSDVQWKVFNLIDIFDIKDGYYNKKPPVDKNGIIPFLGATQYDNGITGFYKKETIEKYDKVGQVSSKDVSKRLFQPNCLAVTNDGSIGNIYYQEYLFTCSHSVTVLYLKNYKLNKHIAKFLIPLLKKSGESFEYGKKWRPKRMRKSKLTLPVDDSGKPYWIFIESYIKQEQKKQAIKLKNYYEGKFYQLAGELAGLEEVEWKEFPVGDLFAIKIGKNIDGNKVNKEHGKTAYITRKENTNGLDGFIDENSNLLNVDYPVITIGNETAEPFVQEFPFFTGTKVNILIPRFNAEVPTLKFIATSLRQHKSKYSYSFTINSTRLNKQNILLPIDENGTPNWQYMSDFVKKIELDKVEKVLSYIYIYRKIRVFAHLQLVERHWKAYALEEVCEILSGQDIYQQDRVIGKTPYLTATENQNGIGYFVANINKTLEKQCISINRNGSVGEAFYHDYPALYGNDTRKLVPKIKDKYVCLFLTQVLRKQKDKYGYGYKMGTKRLKSQKIMLPITPHQKIDYDFMANYVKLQEFTKIYHIIKKLEFEGG